MSSRFIHDILPTSAAAADNNNNNHHDQKLSSPYSPLLLPLILFPFSTVITISALTTIPLPSPLPTEPTPKSLSLIVASLSDYAFSSPFGASILPILHLLLVLSLVTIWKHAWSIPGAVLLNVIAGGIWGGFSGTVIMTILTATGSIAATLISQSLSHWLEGVMPRAIQVTKSALDAHSSSSDQSNTTDSGAPWVRLAMLRLIGVVPWSGINIASGVVRVPLLDCFIGAIIGCAPWTAVTCQVGDILNELGSAVDADRSVWDVLRTRQVIVKLIFLTILGTLPLFAKGVMKRFTRSNTTEIDGSKRMAWWQRRFTARARALSRQRYDEEKMPLSLLSSVKDS